jgi:hypothetical protein
VVVFDDAQNTHGVCQYVLWLNRFKGVTMGKLKETYCANDEELHVWLDQPEQCTKPTHLTFTGSDSGVEVLLRSDTVKHLVRLEALTKPEF